MIKHSLAIAALSTISAFALLSSGAASASNLLDPTVSTTSVIDGSSVRLEGTLRDINGDAQPWTTQLYAFPGECVRFFVSSTAFDAELTVVSPSGLVYRDDDGGGLNRPLVKIASAPEQGWYTVQVAHYAGRPTVSNFSLLYGRYSSGNVNCSVGTVPTMDAAKAAKIAAEQMQAR